MAKKVPFKNWQIAYDALKSKLPENITPAIGRHIKLRQEDGDDIDAVIMDIKENTITLDANHPLAGATLILEVELVEIA